MKKFWQESGKDLIICSIIISVPSVCLFAPIFRDYGIILIMSLAVAGIGSMPGIIVGVGIGYINTKLKKTPSMEGSIAGAFYGMLISGILSLIFLCVPFILVLFVLPD